MILLFVESIQHIRNLKFEFEKSFIITSQCWTL